MDKEFIQEYGKGQGEKMGTMKKKILWGALGIFFVSLGLLSLLLYRSIDRIAQGQAHRLLQTRVEFSEVELDFLKRIVTVHNLKVFHPDRANEMLVEVEKLRMSLWGNPFRKIDAPKIAIHLEKPKILFITDRRGEWEISNRVPMLRRGPGEERLKPFDVEEVTVTDGELIFRDGRVSRPPIVTSLKDIQLRVEELGLPTEQNPLPAKFVTSFKIGDSAKAQLEGKGDFLSPKTSLAAKLTVAGLPLPPYAAYYDHGLPVRILKGYASFSTHASCEQDYFHIPARARVSDLQVELKKQKAFGFVADMAIDSLKNRHGQVELDFLIQGPLTHPQILVLTDFNKAVQAGFSQKMKGVGTTIKEGTKSGFGKVKDFFTGKKKSEK